MTTQKQVGVYILQNSETCETYIGSGVLPERKKNHFSNLRNNTHPNWNLQEAYNQSPNFEFIGIPIPNRDQAYEIEQTLIDEYKNNPLLLNISLDVSTCRPAGWNHTEETKEYLRQQKLGSTLSEETRAKMSLSRIGNKNSLGYKHTEETIEKRRATQIGHVVSAETREKMRISQLGKTQHPNTLKATSKPINVNGIEYPSIAEASRELNVSTVTIHSRLKNEKHVEWQYVKC